MAIVYCYGDCPLADGYAKEAAETLTVAYPNHSWWVECKQGCLIIKHFGISGLVGMVRHTAALDGDATARKAEIKRAAGELLERAGLPRGAYNGDKVRDLDVDKDLKKYWLRRPGAHMKIIH